MMQGPLCQHALDALDAIIHFSANSAELQAHQQHHGVAPGALSSSMAAADSLTPGLAPLSAGTGVASSAATAAAGQGVDLQGLAACLLPQLDVVELLQRVLDSCAVPAKRRRYKLLPFLGDSVLVGRQHADQDDC